MPSVAISRMAPRIISRQYGSSSPKNRAVPQASGGGAGAATGGGAGGAAGAPDAPGLVSTTSSTVMQSPLARKPRHDRTGHGSPSRPVQRTGGRPPTAARRHQPPGQFAGLATTQT